MLEQWVGWPGCQFLMFLTWGRLQPQAWPCVFYCELALTVVCLELEQQQNFRWRGGVGVSRPCR
jgi:hypothetical protein